MNEFTTAYVKFARSRPYPLLVNLHRIYEPKSESDFTVMDLTIVVGDISTVGHSKRNDGREEFWVRMKDGQNIYLENMEEHNGIYEAMEEYYKIAMATA